MGALLIATALFEGLRAGAGTFRLLLDLPARHELGPLAFAAFSRATDLSTRGVIFYALYGFGGALLTAASWYAARRAGSPRRARALLGIACACSVTVLLLTTQAAPLMWQVGRTFDDAAALTDLLDRFTFWTVLRILCADVSFVCVIGAMASMLRRPHSAASS